MHAYLKLSGCYEVQVQQNINRKTVQHILFNGDFFKSTYMEASGRFVMKTDNFLFNIFLSELTEILN